MPLHLLHSISAGPSTSQILAHAYRQASSSEASTNGNGTNQAGTSQRICVARFSTNAQGDLSKATTVLRRGDRITGTLVLQKRVMNPAPSTSILRAGLAGAVEINVAIDFSQIQVARNAGTSHDIRQVVVLGVGPQTLFAFHKLCDMRAMLCD